MSDEVGPSATTGLSQNGKGNLTRSSQLAMITSVASGPEMPSLGLFDTSGHAIPAFKPAFAACRGFIRSPFSQVGGRKSVSDRVN